MRQVGLIGAVLLVAACSDPAPVGGTEGEDGTGTSGSTSSADNTQGQDSVIPEGTGSDGSDGSTSTPGTSDTTTTGEDSTGSTSTTTGTPPGSVEECFEGQFVNEPPQSDYDQYSPVVGSHCVGTNHQDIADVERVVFLGDSITVGSRPTLPGQAYRSVLGDTLRDAFGLSYGDPLAENLWKAPNPFSGEAAQMTAGDFTSCSRWVLIRALGVPPATGW